MAKPNLKVVDGNAEDPLRAPAHLGPEGRECWDRHVRELRDAGIVGQVDLTLVEQAAEMYEGRRQAQAAVRENGQLIPGRSGMKKNPAVSKQIEYAREYRQVMKAIDRQKERATPTGKDDDDPFSF